MSESWRENRLDIFSKVEKMNENQILFIGIVTFLDNLPLSTLA